MRKMLFCSSTLKFSTSMVLSSRRKSSASSLPGISQFPPWHNPLSPSVGGHPALSILLIHTLRAQHPQVGQPPKNQAVWGVGEGTQYLVQVVVGLGALQAVPLPLLGRQPCQHLVEDVVVALSLGLESRGQSWRGVAEGTEWGAEPRTPSPHTWKTTRDFSSRYCEVMAPQIKPLQG